MLLPKVGIFFTMEVASRDFRSFALTWTVRWLGGFRTDGLGQSNISSVVATGNVLIRTLLCVELRSSTGWTPFIIESSTIMTKFWWRSIFNSGVERSPCTSFLSDSFTGYGVCCFPPFDLTKSCCWLIFHSEMMVSLVKSSVHISSSEYCILSSYRAADILRHVFEILSPVSLLMSGPAGWPIDLHESRQRALKLASEIGFPFKLNLSLNLKQSLDFFCRLISLSDSSEWLDRALILVSG